MVEGVEGGMLTATVPVALRKAEDLRYRDKREDAKILPIAPIDDSMFTSSSTSHAPSQ